MNSITHCARITLNAVKSQFWRVARPKLAHHKCTARTSMIADQMSGGP